jgi:EmrB/QacA subfamily drug resistance transporter
VSFSEDDGHPRRRAILAVLCLSMLIVVIDTTILNIALPTFARELSASTTDLQWIADAYTLVFACLLITAGALGDRYGRRSALLFGLVVFVGGSIAAALSHDAAALIGCRAVMGVGGAFVLPATLSLLSAVFPVKERAGAIGLWAACAGLAIVVGPVLGGFLLSHFYWGSVFLINVPVVAGTVLAVLAVIPNLAGQRAAGTRLDLFGATLSAISLLALVDALIEGPDRHWTSRLTLAELFLSVVFAAGFAIRELRAAHPLIDVRVFAHRAFSAACAAITITFFALFGAVFALTQYLQLVHGYSPLSAGLRTLPFAAAVLIVAPMSNVLVRALGLRIVVSVGLGLMGLGLLVLTRLSADSSYLLIAVGVAVMGLGIAMVTGPTSESIMSVLPREQAGAGSAINDTVQELGGTLGVAVIGSVVSSSYRASIDRSGLPPSLRQAARPDIASADAAIEHAGALSGQLAVVAQQGFTTAMTHGFAVAGGCALVGALAVSTVLPRRVSLARHARQRASGSPRANSID